MLSRTLRATLLLSPQNPSRLDYFFFFFSPSFFFFFFIFFFFSPPEMLEFIEEALDEITLAIESFVEGWQVDPVGHEFDIGPRAARSWRRASES